MFEDDSHVKSWCFHISWWWIPDGHEPGDKNGEICPGKEPREADPKQVFVANLGAFGALLWVAAMLNVGNPTYTKPTI